MTPETASRRLMASDLQDDESSEQDEFDPRWEVQPEHGDEDGSGSLRGAFIALVVIAAVVGLLAWLLIGSPPAL